MTDFPTFLAGVRPAIETALDRLLPPESTPPRRIHEGIRYSVFAGGKRIRPALTMLTGEALGVPGSTLVEAGSALEMIHTYSLIHDDLPALDDDALRRGQPTLHKRYDEATAILAGDALLTLGLTTLATYPKDSSGENRRRAVEMVGTAVGTLGMIGGQVEDLEAEDEWPDDAPAVLEAIHRRKTGELLKSALRLAGIHAGASVGERRTLNELGDHIGLLFQIGDDILDVEGTSGTLGKTAGKDAATRKLTYPGLYGLGEAKGMLVRTRDQALALLERLPSGGGLFPSLIRYLATRDC